jgi:hypothetical protein
VRVAGAAEDLAVFEHGTWGSGGTLRLASGLNVRVTTGFWQSRVDFLLDDDTLLFRYHTEGFLRHGARIEICHAGERLAELPWLLCYGWYLVVMMQQDAAAAATVAIVS